MKAVIVTGLLDNLSDNIIPFLGKDTDIYVHTWDTPENHRWVVKLNRYKKYCNQLKVVIEQPLYSKKLYSYFFSTWSAVNLIEDIDKYEYIIKFKPNLQAETITYLGHLEKYFYRAYIQSTPLLAGIAKEDCIYGSIYYKTLDERMFSGYPLAFKKAFHIQYDDFNKQMIILDKSLTKKYSENYEGSIFWMEWFKAKGIKLIQDTDLKLTNNIKNEHSY